MIGLQLPRPPGRPLRLLALGAHPDDVEIGAGGTLLRLAEEFPGLDARVVVFTGTPPRAAEAVASAPAFLPGAKVEVAVHDFADGRLPAYWNRVKDLLGALSAEPAPDVIVAPTPTDAHQDHRLLAELVPTAFRDSLVLGYEIPKWDGDLGRPSVYVPLPEEVARRKVDLLQRSFPSQRGRDWWDAEVFLGLARVRGMECRARYAEAFTCSKATLLPV